MIFLKVQGHLHFMVLGSPDQFLPILLACGTSFLGLVTFIIVTMPFHNT